MSNEIASVQTRFAQLAPGLAAEAKGSGQSVNIENILQQALQKAINDYNLENKSNITEYDVKSEKYDTAVEQATEGVNDVIKGKMTGNTYYVNYYKEDGTVDKSKSAEYRVLQDGSIQKGEYLNGDATIVYSVSKNGKWEEKSKTNQKDTEANTPDNVEAEEPEKETSSKEDATEKNPSTDDNSSVSKPVNSDSSSTNSAKDEESTKVLLTTDHSVENEKVSSYNDGYLLASAADPLKLFRSYVNHTGQKRYYSSTDVRIAAGNGEFLTEVVAISWTLQERKMPLFGYNSYTFDEMAIGSRMIQGNFVINFIVPDYLHQVITKGETDSASNSNIYACTKSTSSKTNHIESYEYIPRNFTICLGYGGDTSGSNKQENAKCYVFFEHVFIESQGQMIAEDGTPIYEQYSFIARDVRYTK